MSRPVALVTGASAGIGDAFARQLAARAYNLVVVARDVARLDALAKELAAQHRTEVEVIGADLTDAAQLAAVEQRVGSLDAPVDLLVNNAGFGTVGPVAEGDRDAASRMIALNVDALVRLTHAALPAMVARDRGGVINVASLAAFQPTADMATYGATKAFVLSFSQAVHEELRGTKVTVSCLCPGFTRTEFQERAGAEASNMPAFVWQSAEEVALAGLAGFDKGRAVVLPGLLNKATAGVVSVTPTSITRRVAALLARSFD